MCLSLETGKSRDMPAHRPESLARKEQYIFLSDREQTQSPPCSECMRETWNRSAARMVSGGKCPLTRAPAVCRSRCGVRVDCGRQLPYCLNRAAGETSLNISVLGWALAETPRWIHTHNVDLHNDGLYWSCLGRDPILADANDGGRVSRGLGIQEKGNKGRPVTRAVVMAGQL